MSLQNHRLIHSRHSRLRPLHEPRLAFRTSNHNLNTTSTQPILLAEEEMEYSPALSVNSDMTEEELERYFETYIPLSNLPTPPPAKEHAIPSAPRPASSTPSLPPTTPEIFSPEIQGMSVQVPVQHMSYFPIEHPRSRMLHEAHGPPFGCAIIPLHIDSLVARHIRVPTPCACIFAVLPTPHFYCYGVTLICKTHFCIVPVDQLRLATHSLPQ